MCAETRTPRGKVTFQGHLPKKWWNWVHLKLGLLKPKVHTLKHYLWRRKSWPIATLTEGRWRAIRCLFCLNNILSWILSNVYSISPEWMRAGATSAFDHHWKLKCLVQCQTHSKCSENFGWNLSNGCLIWEMHYVVLYIPESREHTWCCFTNTKEVSNDLYFIPHLYSKMVKLNYLINCPLLHRFSHTREQSLLPSKAKC